MEEEEEAILFFIKGEDRRTEDSSLIHAPLPKRRERAYLLSTKDNYCAVGT